MLENFDLGLLQGIDRFLRGLTDSEVTQRDIEQMLETILVWRRSGRSREGYPIGTKALRCARLLNNPALLMMAVSARATLACDTLDINTSIEYHLEALELARKVGDRMFEGRTYLNLAVACRQLSLDIVSLRCLEHALKIAEQLQGDQGMAHALECIASCAMAANLLQLKEYGATLAAAQRSQLAGQEALPYLKPGDTAAVQDAVATSRCCEVVTLVRMGLFDAARATSQMLDRGNAASAVTGSVARIALATLDAATGNLEIGIEELQRVIKDPLAQHHRRGAMYELVECYEFSGLHDSALLALQELQHEIEAGRREVAIEELRRLDGIDPALDKEFETTTRNRIASYLVRIDGVGSRLFSKLHYLNEIAVSAEIREGNEENRAEHIFRVGALCSLLAAEAGYNEEFRWLAEVAGRLHDVGKSAIPDAIVLKSRALSAAEWQVVQGHSDHGARLLAEADEPKLVEVAAALRHHHERFDGSGYPSNLKDHEIPLLARIVAISESFDAMRQSRNYRSGRSMRAALQEIERGAGSQFDPHLAGLFVQMIRRYQRQVDDLDQYLGEQGRSSPAVQTFARLSSLFVSNRQA